MTTDYRAMCAELVDDLELCDWHYKLKDTIRADIERARALLAEPKVEGPSASDVTELFYRHMGEGSEVGFENAIAEALARWGHHPAPPGDGEVAELVECLRRICFDVAPCDAAAITRAAELLEQRHPTPVPVSERLPGPEDCDAGGCCWAWEEDGDTWELTPSKWLPKSWGSCTHWLPAHVLPTPEATND